MKNIEQAIKLFPLFSLVLIGFGFYSLHNYYNYFEISIAEFLTPSEILLSFVPNLFITVPFFIASIFIALQTAIIEEQIGGFSNKGYRYKSFFYYLKFILSIKRLKRVGFKGFLKVLLRMTTKFSVWIFVFTLYQSIKLYFEMKDLGYADFMFRSEILLITLQWFALLLIVSSNEFKNSILSRMALVLQFFVLIIALLSLDNSCKANSVLFGLGEKRIEFSYKDEHINTDSIYTFIGMTRDYLFLYNNHELESNVFEKSKTSRLKIKKGVDVEKDVKEKLLKIKREENLTKEELEKLFYIMLKIKQKNK